MLLSLKRKFGNENGGGAPTKAVNASASIGADERRRLARMIVHYISHFINTQESIDAVVSQLIAGPRPDPIIPKHKPAPLVIEELPSAPLKVKISALLDSPSHAISMVPTTPTVTTIETPIHPRPTPKRKPRKRSKPLQRIVVQKPRKPVHRAAYTISTNSSNFGEKHTTPE